jgi:hypothetical protein
LAEPVTESKLGESGLQFNSDNFSLSMKSRVQFRMTYQNEVANGENGTNGRDFINFRVRRAKTEFKGHIFEKEFQYKLLLNWTSVNVENAVFTWAWRDEMNVNAGQDKLNWNWEEFTSSASQNFVERSAVNEVFNQDYGKGIWINGKFGDETPFLKYWFGVYNGVLAGNNDFRNADMAQRADTFSNLVDNEMMINLRLETHPMGNVANKMYDDRSSENMDSVLFAIGLGLNWMTSGFNDAALRPDTVGTPTASGRSRTSQDTLAVTLDGHLRVAVVDDVRDFLGGEIGVDAGEVETGALARRARFEVARVVLHEDGVVVEALEIDRPQQMGELVGPGLELGVRDGLSGVGHDEGRAIGVIDGAFPEVHAGSPWGNRTRLNGGG